MVIKTKNLVIKEEIEYTDSETGTHKKELISNMKVFPHPDEENFENLEIFPQSEFIQPQENQLIHVVMRRELTNKKNFNDIDTLNQLKNLGTKDYDDYVYEAQHLLHKGILDFNYIQELLSKSSDIKLNSKSLELLNTILLYKREVNELYLTARIEKGSHSDSFFFSKLKKLVDKLKQLGGVSSDIDSKISYHVYSLLIRAIYSWEIDNRKTISKLYKKDLSFDFSNKFLHDPTWFMCFLDLSYFLELLIKDKQNHSNFSNSLLILDIENILHAFSSEDSFINVASSVKKKNLISHEILNARLNEFLFWFNAKPLKQPMNHFIGSEDYLDKHETINLFVDPLVIAENIKKVVILDPHSHPKLFAITYNDDLIAWGSNGNGTGTLKNFQTPIMIHNNIKSVVDIGGLVYTLDNNGCLWMIRSDNDDLLDLIINYSPTIKNDIKRQYEKLPLQSWKYDDTKIKYDCLLSHYIENTSEIFLMLFDLYSALLFPIKIAEDIIDINECGIVTTRDNQVILLVQSDERINYLLSHDQIIEQILNKVLPRYIMLDVGSFNHQLFYQDYKQNYLYFINAANQLCKLDFTSTINNLKADNIEVLLDNVENFKILETYPRIKRLFFLRNNSLYHQVFDGTELSASRLMMQNIVDYKIETNSLYAINSKGDIFEFIEKNDYSYPIEIFQDAVDYEVTSKGLLILTKEKKALTYSRGKLSSINNFDKIEVKSITNSCDLLIDNKNRLILINPIYKLKIQEIRRGYDTDTRWL